MTYVNVEKYRSYCCDLILAEGRGSAKCDMTVWEGKAEDGRVKEGVARRERRKRRRRINCAGRPRMNLGEKGSC